MNLIRFAQVILVLIVALLLVRFLVPMTPGYAKNMGDLLGVLAIVCMSMALVGLCCGHSGRGCNRGS